MSLLRQQPASPYMKVTFFSTSKSDRDIEVRLLAGQRGFSLLQKFPDQHRGPSIVYSFHIKRSFPGVKQPGSETGHSFTSIAQEKNVRNSTITSTNRPHSFVPSIFDGTCFMNVNNFCPIPQMHSSSGVLLNLRTNLF